LVSYPGGINSRQMDLSTDARIRVAW
jgi:hypothetical protein